MMGHSTAARAPLKSIPCSVEDCARPSGARSEIGPLCLLHYNRHKRRGTTEISRTVGDIAGMRFGRLLVTKFNGTRRSGNRSERTWICTCDCGSVRIVATGSLTKGNTHFNARKSTMSEKRKRDSTKARRICFEAHKWTDHMGRVMLTCHLNKCVIDPVRMRWRADHITHWANGGEDTAENLWPICEKCDREEKAPKDASEIAKGKRVYDRHYHIKQSSGWGNRRFKKKISGEVVER